MTESEVRKLLKLVKEEDSQKAFHDFYYLTYDRLFRIAYYYIKKREISRNCSIYFYETMGTTKTTSRGKKYRRLLLYIS